MISIYDYLDYRLFLKEIFEQKKQENYHFSHRFLAQRLGIRAPGHILYVIQGKRRISEKLALKLANFLKLKKKETEYFLYLIRYADAKNPSEKQFAFECLSRLRRQKVKQVVQVDYAIYEKWYYEAIRAAIEVQPFDKDYGRLARSLNPPIQPNEAKEAVELLVRHNLIARDEKGIYHPVDRVISTGDEWQSATIHHLQQQLITLGKDALDRFSKTERDISSVTITVSEQSFETIRQKIQELRAEILELAQNEQTADRVIQCNFQAFPLFYGCKENDA